ncbi:unnamed protein product [Clonostachys rosea]|uniref:Aminoglycoside phosphotransferase domain-containing protein n=1 Tax=Bionectria ochroleuca TaxID=29856 RepID=A0ABY6TSH2_BIOOC|nr:unnamed protein product [Clonostachys rosea]
MAWNQFAPESRTRWTPGSNSHPIWPSEPDPSTIRAIAAEALRVSADALTVSPLGSGAYHKVYDITKKEQAPACRTYLFRVAVPVDPVYKMESEMATLEFLRRRTTIPVPRPVAWNSSSSNPLGFEWALVEKAPGVELRSVWDDLPWERKAALVESIAGYLAQLWSPDLRFSHIGSIYCAGFGAGESSPDRSVASAPSASFGMSRVETATRGGFKIGPMVDVRFVSGRRRHLPTDRGPYDSCQDWLAALIDTENSFISSAALLFKDIPEESKAARMGEEEDIGDVIGYEEEGDCDHALESCHRFWRALPSVVPAGSQEGEPDRTDARFLLSHWDLRTANIIVDPESLEITGIIDWENAVTVPKWTAMDYPLMLKKAEPLYDRPSATITAALRNSCVQSDEIDSRKKDLKKWEAKDLRFVFACKLEELGYGSDWRPTSPSDKRKRDFLDGITDVTFEWERANRTLRRIRDQLRARPDTSSPTD